MFLTNGMKATLIKHNRKQTGVWDDEYIEKKPIILCPYNQDIRVAFGVYTIPEAEGYYIVKNTTDIKEGDQITFNGQTFTVLRVKDNWIWNKIVNYTVAVK
jgi:hypothetical protein